MSMTLTCNYCDEDMLPSNFRFRLHRSKKMPKKSIKLYHNQSQVLLTDPCKSKSKSQNYICRLSKPRNSIIMKCNNCTLATTMKTLKPKYVPPAITVEVSPQSPHLNQSKNKKKARKTKTLKDVNAGLIIPPSMRLSTDSPSHSNNNPKSTLFSNQASTTTTTQQIQSIQQNHQFSKFSQEKRRKIKIEQKKSKEKEVNQLQKALLKSKEMSNLGSVSLNHFLGNTE